MASSCPVLTSDRYGSQEIAGGAAQLVNPESVDSIAAGLETILSDGALRSRLIEQGRLRSEHFTWAKCGEATLRVLERLAPGS